VRLLVLTPFVPDSEAPAGCPRAVFDRLSLLAGEHEIAVACLATADERGRTAAVEGLGVRLVTAPRKPPSSRFGTAATRLRQAAGLLLPRRPDLVQRFGSARLRRRVRRLGADFGPEVVLVEHVLMAQYLAAVPTGVPVVLTDHDVHLALGDPADAPRGLQAYDAWRWRTYAEQAYRRARSVLVPTAEDAAFLARNVPGIGPGVVPFGLAAGGEGEPALPRDDVLLFVGNYAHPPNRDAAAWLAREILPLVRRKRPGVELQLVGSEPTPDVTALAGPGVVVTGHVPSVAPYLAGCSVFVAPLRLGGGVRMKLLEALAAGVPVVTTTVGAAGLDAVPGRDLLVGDSSEEFAAAVVRLLEDPALRASVAAHGRRRTTADREARRTLLGFVLRGAVRDGVAV
jgi:glycosyltransferase involved in cell wall biosynthesis